MQISNVTEISDNGASVAITTETGTIIYLPYAKHRLVIEDDGCNVNVNIVFNVK